MECDLGRIAADALINNGSEMINNKTISLLVMATLSHALPLFSQYNGGTTGVAAGNYWHGKERALRYTPDGEDFVIVNGDRRFNRALYGTNTGFRVEAGDKPEFGLYMPNMGGNLQLGVLIGGKSVWLNDMQFVEFRYRPGSALYMLKDPVLGNGVIRLTLLPFADAEGFVLKAEAENVPDGAELFFSYGGASNKRFSREGDLGVDPTDCFELKPDYCVNNQFDIAPGRFDLYYGAAPDILAKVKQGAYPIDKNDKRRPRKLTALFPQQARTKLASPYAVTTPLDMWESEAAPGRPLFTARMGLGGTNYISVTEGFAAATCSYQQLAARFNQAEEKRSALAARVRIETPDPYLNTVGGALAVAADGIWEEPAWLHGAIGWRMPLSGWRAAYTGDVLGWHDRARIHFDAYAASQVTDVEPIYPHPMQDAEKNNARAEKKWGTQMYSNGYISRNPNRNNMMHHYDMNLCYIDELLWHFNWTGDLEYARTMWPVLERHLAWEKRNFDPNNDGLYDAYCCIWASDALQYNSGGVTHSSAYNYRANKLAAQIARKIGKDATPYEAEAKLILNAINRNLWLPKSGRWAEYKDLMGLGATHDSPAIWTIYHAIDSDIHTPFQAYEATRYVDTDIPHIPVRGRGLKDEGYATISTTNWFPYSWSINNVAFAEVAHMALAYWQSGRNEEAFKLLKSSFLDGMYLGGSPGNFGQISFYDAARGECYRDFGDPVGITSRALVQGLFGIRPDRMNGRIEIVPGFPAAWDHASIQTSDLTFAFKRTGKQDTYTVRLADGMRSALTLKVKAPFDTVKRVTVGGKPVAWKPVADAIDDPMIAIEVPAATSADVVIDWSGKAIDAMRYAVAGKAGETVSVGTPHPTGRWKDTQQVFGNLRRSGNALTGKITGETGNRTFFVQQSSGNMKWWEPVSVEVASASQLPASQYVLAGIETKADLQGTAEPVNIDAYFNSNVCDIFQNRYESPRSPYTTLQIPLQGIGEWCHPDMTADIDDAGLRSKVINNVFTTPFGLPFRVSAAPTKNIVYTSLWDNYPNSVAIPLSGKARRAYLLMAGSTNHMQVHFTNGIVRVTYADGSEERLELVNPVTWCPIEQDFFFDDYAFRSDRPRPYRVALKTGDVTRTPGESLKLKGSDNRRIPGGAGILLDLPLDADKELKSVTLETRANDVVIGLMGITLER